MVNNKVWYGYILVCYLLFFDVDNDIKFGFKIEWS